MGFATSRAQARQLVSHGHFTVNGRATNIAVLPGPRGRPRSRSATHQPQDGLLQARSRTPCAARSGPTGSASTPTSWPAASPRCRAATRCRSSSTSSSWSSTTRGNPRSMIELENAQIEPVEELETYGKYEASPLPAGYGVTIGNALRRVLLSSLEGAAVTSIQVRDVYHEFSTHPGRQGRRDPDRPQRQEAAAQELRAAPGPAQAGQVGRRPVTAADITESADVEIVNPEQQLMTLDSDDVTDRDRPDRRARRGLPGRRAQPSSCPSASSRSTPSSRPCARSTTTSRTRASAR